MKAILEFNLPEENNEFMLAKRGSEWANILFTFDNQLRTWIKHGHPFNKKSTVEEVLDSVKQRLNEEMQDSNLTFDDLA